MTRIEAPTIDFKDGSVPHASDFGDIYFSPEDGLAETELVFLQGNNLPQAWQGQSDFTIAETGFGTGLNFLAAVKLFRENPGHCRHLHYISTERYPLSHDQLRQALQPCISQGLETERLLQVYPMRIPGFHRIWFCGDVTLTLIFDDVIKGLHALDASVDAWFLDGFAPAKNPGMWNDSLYQAMARLSHRQTTLASFTAAGDVRRGLQQAGFQIERLSGFADKRHRIVGTYPGANKGQLKKPGSVAIIGAGLAGATLARALSRHDITCTVFDAAASPGENASSNRLGLINPKLDVGHADVNDLGQSMYSFALHRVKDMAEAVCLQRKGTLHKATDDVKKKRQDKIVDSLDWLPDHVRMTDDGLYFPDAATLDTAKLVRHLLDGVAVQWSSAISDLQALRAQYDHIIIASAEAAMAFYPQLQNILQPMRGQVTFLKAPYDLPCPLVSGHYVAPVDDTTWVTGATFQRQRTDTIPLPADDAENIHALHTLIPGLTEHPEITGHWAQVRYTTPDRRPVLGCIENDVDIVTALGSHGLQYGFILAEILASRLTGMPVPVSRDVLGLPDLQRYLK